MSSDVNTFAGPCIYCLFTVNEEIVLAPLGPAVHGTSQNDLLQLDYIEIEKANLGEKYAVLLKDEHSNFCWFHACPETFA